MIGQSYAVKLDATALSQVEHRRKDNMVRESELKEYQRIAMKELEPALAAVKQFAGDHSVALLGLTPIGDLFGIGKAPEPSRVVTTDNGDGTGCSCSGGSKNPNFEKAAMFCQTNQEEASAAVY